MRIAVQIPILRDLSALRGDNEKSLFLSGR